MFIKKVIGLSLLAVGVGVGCTEAPMTSEEVALMGEGDMELGQTGEGLCSNGDGVNSAMAALAVAAAKELGRWNPTTDFAPGTASPWYTTLTATGKARCSDGKCWQTQAILDLQKAPPNTTYITFGSSHPLSALIFRKISSMFRFFTPRTSTSYTSRIRCT